MKAWEMRACEKEGAASFEHSSERFLWNVPVPCHTLSALGKLRSSDSLHRIPFILADSTADVSIGLKLWGEHLPPLEPPSGFLVQFAVVHSGGDHWQTGQPSAECWIGVQTAFTCCQAIVGNSSSSCSQPCLSLT